MLKTIGQPVNRYPSGIPVRARIIRVQASSTRWHTVVYARRSPLIGRDSRHTVVELERLGVRLLARLKLTLTASTEVFLLVALLPRRKKSNRPVVEAGKSVKFSILPQMLHNRRHRLALAQPQSSSYKRLRDIIEKIRHVTDGSSGWRIRGWKASLGS